MNSPLRILLVEDVPDDAELVERELRREGLRFESQRVYERESYLRALSERPDLVLSDFALPQFDGLTALALLKERHPDVPFILISGAIGEDLAVAAMREGAADYLLKDRLSRLPTAISARSTKRGCAGSAGCSKIACCARTAWRASGDCRPASRTISTTSCCRS